MGETASVHVIRKHEFRDGIGDWKDPHGLFSVTAEKRCALLANPLSTDDQDPVRLIGTHNGIVVGTIDLLVGAFDVDGETVRTIWGSNYYVAEEARRTLMGVKLLVAMQRLHHTVSACNISQLALPIYQTLKWVDFSLPRYFHIRHSRAVIEHYIGASRWALVASRAADPALLLHGRALTTVGRGRLAGLRCEQVAVAPNELDALLRRSRRHRIVPHRSAAWLNWLLAHSLWPAPTDRTGLFLIYDEGDHLAGYLLLKMRFYPTASRGLRNVRIGSVQDWGIFDDERLTRRDVVLLGLRLLERWSPDLVEVSSDQPDVRDWLRRRGIPRFGAVHVVVNAGAGSPLRAPELQDQINWRLTAAEGDGFLS